MDTPGNGNGSQLGPVEPVSVHAALDRVLASEAFANAGRLSRFLRFSVEQALAGQGERLKEYVLGVEVFDRTDAFDPRLDSIVRVEARRLRAKLTEYYDQEGAADPLVIRLRKGSYVPRFEPRLGASPSSASDLTPSSADRPLESPSNPRVKSWAMVAAALGVAALIAIGAGWRWGSTSGSSSPRVTVAVLPLVNHSGDPAQDALADRLTDAVISELARVPTLGVRSRTSILQYKAPHRSLREVARALDADVLMEASVVAEGGQVKVDARLVRASSDMKFWVDDFSGRPDDLPGLAQRIAAAAAAAIARQPPSR